MLEEAFFKFVKKNLDQRACLLGLSGGPDSMALFHLLVKAGHPFQVAHIDHGWREESAKEAEFLEKMCLDLKIPFHLQVLKEKVESNLEDFGREARFHFFKTICKKEDLQGVFVAHHADDLAETVLKRIFEGANLYKLKGLKEISEREGLKIYRPFLPFRKKNLLEWLDKESVTYFSDPTNEDTRFLRSRLRKNLIPQLSKEFGKELTKSLCRLSKQSYELEDFLEESLIPYRTRIAQKEGAFFLDLRENPPQSDFLWKAVLKDFLFQSGVCASDSVLDQALFHLKKGSQNRALCIEKQVLKINRRTLSISKKSDMRKSSDACCQE